MPNLPNLKWSSSTLSHLTHSIYSKMHLQRRFFFLMLHSPVSRFGSGRTKVLHVFIGEVYILIKWFLLFFSLFISTMSSTTFQEYCDPFDIPVSVLKLKRKTPFHNRYSKRFPSIMCALKSKKNKKKKNFCDDDIIACKWCFIRQYLIAVLMMMDVEHIYEKRLK